MRNLLIAGLLAATVAAPAFSATVTVQMKNKASTGPGFMVFEPAFVQVKPGDTVVFKATDAGHDAASIPGMAPAGAAPFKGDMGKDVSVTFAKPGVYGVKCDPHFGLGMVALIEVGKPTNLADAQKAAASLPGLAKQKMAGLLTQVK
jgi:pseudoazurin